MRFERNSIFNLDAVHLLPGRLLILLIRYRVKATVVILVQVDCPLSPSFFQMIHIFIWNGEIFFLFFLMSADVIEGLGLQMYELVCRTPGEIKIL